MYRVYPFNYLPPLLRTGSCLNIGQSCTKRKVRFCTTRHSHHHRVTTVEEARTYLATLSNTELQNLSSAITEVLAVQHHPSEPTTKPTRKQLQLVLLQAALPFVGFGFLDNFIMIIAGEYIDLTIGVALGISTMAAAALGNLISDLCGLGLADSVEALCHTLGLPNPQLTVPQMKISSVRWMERLGRIIGVTIGCVLGMAPLYWFDNHHENQDTDNPPSKADTT